MRIALYVQGVVSDTLQSSEVVPDFDPIRIVTTETFKQFVNCILLGISIYLITKIYRLLRLKDPSLLISIVSITLALICIISGSVVYCIFLYKEFYTYEEMYPFKRLQSQLEALKVMFIFSAFVCDIYKWCIFILMQR